MPAYELIEVPEDKPLEGYKITDFNAYTRGSTLWGWGVTNTVWGGVPEKCGRGWLHFYEDAHVGALMNRVQGGFTHPIYWACLAWGKVVRWPDGKLGCTNLRTTYKVIEPVITPEQRIEAALRAVQQLDLPFGFEEFKGWVRDWLNNWNRLSSYAEWISDRWFPSSLTSEAVANASQSVLKAVAIPATCEYYAARSLHQASAAGVDIVPIIRAVF
jgi:hypothetical protein